MYDEERRQRKEGEIVRVEKKKGGTARLRQTLEVLMPLDGILC